MSGPAFCTIIEPFLIHSVEPLRTTTRDERRAAVARAGYDLYPMKVQEVLIDLLTDSDTGRDESRPVGRDAAGHGRTQPAPWTPGRRPSARP